MTDELKNLIHREIKNAIVKIFVVLKDDTKEFKGTGFFITPDGYVLTAYHCIGDFSPPIEIETRFDGFVKAQLEKDKSLKDSQYDIAVLKVDYSPSHYIPLGKISEQHITHEIVAMGYPAGHRSDSQNLGIYFGHISRFNANNKIECDAIKGQGQSGGPIYHYKTHRVIGLTVLGFEPNVMIAGLATRFDPLFEKWYALERINNQVIQSWEKRLEQSSDKDDDDSISRENTTVSGNTMKENVLSRDFFDNNPSSKQEFVDALLACSGINDRDSRSTVLRQLPLKIRNRISDTSVTRIHVLNIVDGCMEFSGGVEQLVNALRYIEDESQSMQALETLIQQFSIKPPIPSYIGPTDNITSSECSTCDIPLGTIINVHSSSEEQLRTLQSETSNALGLSTFFKDELQDGGDASEMVVIPAGQFKMGSCDMEAGRNTSEGPQHEVTISKPFALGRYVVTIAEYIQFCHNTGRTHLMSGYRSERGNYPITNVSWEQAVAFADWLSDQTGQEYRLPTEAEWEYATRAGTLTPFYFGNEVRKRQVNFKTGGPVSVGTLPVNIWGLHELHGNVWEWVQDTWHKSYVGAPTDGSAWITDLNTRVIRGGSYNKDKYCARSASREQTSPDSSLNFLGFRFAREL
jgi:formylglycine-generating enzyme required for sulfatase activity